MTRREKSTNLLRLMFLNISKSVFAFSRHRRRFEGNLSGLIVKGQMLSTRRQKGWKYEKGSNSTIPPLSPLDDGTGVRVL